MAQGPIGATGGTGATGPSGLQGPIGPQGESGPTGATGPAGVCGCNGCTAYAYIAGDDTVSVVDPHTHEVVRTLPVEYVQLVAANPARGELYAALEGGGLLALNSSTGAVLRRIDGIEVSSLAFNPGNGKLYAAEMLADAVRVYDAATFELLDTLHFTAPHGIAVNPVTGIAYALVEYFGGLINIAEMDGGAGATVFPGYNATALATCAACGRMYAVGGPSPGSVTRYDVSGSPPAEEKTANTYLYDPKFAAYNPNTNRIYIGFASSNDIEVLDGDSLGHVDHITLDGDTVSLAADPENDLVYASDGSSTYVFEGDSNTPVSTLPVGGAISVADCGHVPAGGVTGPTGSTGPIISSQLL